MPNLHDAGGILIRQRTKQDGIDDGEDGGIRADAQSEHKNRGKRKARAAKQDAKPVSKVGQKISHATLPGTKMRRFALQGKDEKRSKMFRESRTADER